MRRHSLTRYIPPSSDASRHFRITRGQTRHGFEKLDCLLARAWADGKFELLSPGWDTLGYTGDELAGRRISELVALGPEAAGAVVTSLLTEGASVEFGLRCSDESELRYRWHRQYDDFTSSMFIVGEALPRAPSLAA